MLDQLGKVEKTYNKSRVFLIAIGCFCVSQVYEYCRYGTLSCALRGNPNLFHISYAEYPKTFIYTVTMDTLGFLMFVCFPIWALIMLRRNRPTASAVKE
jgi:hypothetical protein